MVGGGIGEFLVVLGVESSMGGIWKEWENVGEEWGSVLGCWGGVGNEG